MANERKRIEQLEQSHKAKLDSAEESRRKSEAAIHEKDSALRAAQARLDSKIRSLEEQIGSKDQLLASRDTEIQDLKNQLQTLTQGIKQMSAFFKQAEALDDRGEQNGKTHADPGPASETQPRREPAANGAKGAAEGVAPKQTVSAHFFKRLTAELTHSVGPMASMIVQDHVAALGESIDRFPAERVDELIELVSQEIADERQKIAFKVRIAAAL